MPTDAAAAAAWPSGTADLSDAAFVAAFEGLELANDRFRHYDHLRLAWICLGDGPLNTATERIVVAIRRFASHHGGSAKFHESMTRAYMRLVAAHRATTPSARDFAGFATANPELFDKRLPFRYYSEALLASAQARAGWVEPDLAEFPPYDEPHDAPTDSRDPSRHAPDRPPPRAG